MKLTLFLLFALSVFWLPGIVILLMDGLGVRLWLAGVSGFVIGAVMLVIVQSDDWRTSDYVRTSSFWLTGDGNAAKQIYALRHPLKLKHIEVYLLAIDRSTKYVTKLRPPAS